MSLSYPMRELVHWTTTLSFSTTLAIVLAPVVAVLDVLRDLASRERTARSSFAPVRRS